jgi:tetratricopeptide (TPR) repeat protein
VKFLWSILFACVAFCVQTGHADGLDVARQCFQDGNAAYEKGDFDAAESLYRRAIDQGVANHHLYSNYANALFRKNKLGLSILYWEKAAKMKADDPDIEHNLKFARARIADKMPEPKPNFLTRALWSVHASYSLNQGLWLALGLFSVTFLVLFGMIVFSGWLKGFSIAALVLVMLGQLVLWPSLGYKINQQESVGGAIVLKPVLEVYSGPGEAYQLLTRVHEGTKFSLEQVSGEWASVQLANGTGGWVRYAELGKI